jgi:hypothetical protein
MLVQVGGGSELKLSIHSITPILGRQHVVPGHGLHCLGEVLELEMMYLFCTVAKIGTQPPLMRLEAQPSQTNCIYNATITTRVRTSEVKST